MVHLTTQQKIDQNSCDEDPSDEEGNLRNPSRSILYCISMQDDNLSVHSVPQTPSQIPFDTISLRPSPT